MKCGEMKIRLHGDVAEGAARRIMALAPLVSRDRLISLTRRERCGWLRSPTARTFADPSDFLRKLTPDSVFLAHGVCN